MSISSSRQPTRAPDESLEILRRLEPALARVESEQRRTGERLATLEGKVSQLPTLIQITSSMLAIIAGMVAISLGLVKLIHSL